MPRAMRILIADDDPIYRDIAAEMLSKAGHVITMAADGGEAISALATAVFDTAIIDLTMPVADGIEVIEKLRAGAANASIPVIVITGHDDAAAVERAYRAGATSFLTKPLNWMLFTPHVEFVMRSGETERQLRDASATAAFLSEMKSQMMAALAHEFQSPIKTIFGFSQLIDKEVYGPIGQPAYKDMFADIERSARSLNASLLKVLNFGRTLTEHLTIDAKPLPALETIHDVIMSYEGQAMRSGLTLSRAIDIPPGITVDADRVLLTQAIGGILDNALRLSPRGSEIAISAAIGSDGELVISIRDKGPSLPDILIDQVNAREAAKTVRHVRQSNDVSIRIAQVLTEAHRGRMTITSGAISGNTVRLALPLSGAASGASQKKPDARANDAAASAQPSSPTETRLARISEELSQDPRIKDRAAPHQAAQRAAPGAPRTLGQLL